MGRLNTLCDTLEDLCAEPSRTGKPEVKVPPSKRKQLVTLRNQIRTSLADIDKKLETVDADANREDPLLEAARAAALERMKRPPHLRGSAVLNETM